jgi:dihydrodipicolinate synthase/N-acetylneuraminate lyase
MFTGQSFDCLACMRGGAVGAICPVALLMPVTSLRLIDAHRAGNASGAEEAQNKFYRAVPVVMPEPGEDGPVGVPHAGVKEALLAVGIIRSSAIRDPQPGLSAERRREVRKPAPQIVEL